MADKKLSFECVDGCCFVMNGQNVQDAIIEAAREYLESLKSDSVCAGQPGDRLRVVFTEEKTYIEVLKKSNDGDVAIACTCTYVCPI